ncbi:hypothetical protein [Streptomyces sp. NPDC001250]|uniref:hypothetical protein n=1 Tax=unclassified Streptomyces TaxID=2593676 RepID=UPI003326ACD8
MTQRLLLPHLPQNSPRSWTTRSVLGLQADLRTLAAGILASAEPRYGSEPAAFQARVEWALLRIENTAAGLAEGRPHPNFRP